MKEVPEIDCKINSPLSSFFRPPSLAAAAYVAEKKRQPYFHTLSASFCRRHEDIAVDINDSDYSVLNYHNHWRSIQKLLLRIVLKIESSMSCSIYE